MIKRYLFLSVLLCVGLLVIFTTSSREQAVYGIKQARLTNGLRLHVIENPRVPAVTHMIWYRFGAAAEPKGSYGVAHYLEHLMFKGTPKIPDGEISKQVQAWGGHDNAFTSYDYTAFFQTVPSDKLSHVMAFEADRMTHLQPSKDGAQSELQVVMSERRQRTENDPSAKLTEQMDRMIYGDRPYGRPVIGSHSDIAVLNLTKAMDFYHTHYRPDNAYVVISGNITLKQALRLAEKTYGQIPVPQNRLQKDKPISPVMPLPYDNVIKVVDNSVQQDMIVRDIVAPSLRTDFNKARALSLAEDILAGSTGRLYQTLVVNQKIASSISVGYSPLAQHETTFTISLYPQKGVTFAQTKQALDAVLQDIARTGFTQDELDKSLERITDSAIFARDSLAVPAIEVGFALAAGLTPRQIDFWQKGLQRIKLKNVNQAFQLVVQPAVYGYLAGQP